MLARPPVGQEAAATAGCDADDEEAEDPAEVLDEAAGAAVSEVELDGLAAVDAVEAPELAESVE